MTKSTENAAACAAFQYLADMEKQHLGIFQGMLAEAEKYKMETPTKEYAGYFQALIDSAVFTDDMVTSAMSSESESDVEAIELAVGAEKDSILFYSQMRDILPERIQPVVSKIIAEEKSHLRQLSELKKTLGSL